VAAAPKPAPPATKPKPAPTPTPAKPAAVAPAAKKPPAAKPLPKARPLEPAKPAPPAKPLPKPSAPDDEDLPVLAPLGSASTPGLTPLGNDPLAGLAPLGNDPLGGLAPLGGDPLAGLSPLGGDPLAPLPNDPFASLSPASNPTGILSPSPLNPYAAPAYGSLASRPAIDDSRRRGLPFQQRAAFHTFWSTTGGILGSPDESFRQMKRRGGLWNPFNFAISATITGNLIILAEYFVAVAGLVSFLSTVFKDDMGWDKIVLGFVLAAGGMIIAGIVTGIVGSLIAAAIFHVLLLAMGSARCGFEATLRVVCYGLGSAWMLGPIPCVGTLLMPIWQIIILIQGFKHAHGISGGMAALAVIPVLALYWTCIWGVTILPYLIPWGAGSH
jgi:hypothetical protein